MELLSCYGICVGPAVSEFHVVLQRLFQCSLNALAWRLLHKPRQDYLYETFQIGVGLQASNFITKKQDLRMSHLQVPNFLWACQFYDLPPVSALLCTIISSITALALLFLIIPRRKEGLVSVATPSYLSLRKGQAEGTQLQCWPGELGK